MEEATWLKMRADQISAMVHGDGKRLLELEHAPPIPEPVSTTGEDDATGGKENSG